MLIDNSSGHTPAKAIGSLRQRFPNAFSPAYGMDQRDKNFLIAEFRLAVEFNKLANITQEFFFSRRFAPPYI
jgi:hypothetical protein